MLVTLRRAKGLPSLRSQVVHREVVDAVRTANGERFRVVHYSVQADHVHMVVEAEDNASLSAGMKRFAVSVAMRVNLRVRRKRRGKVWADRYHRRDLRSPSQVRNTLVYVISNHLKHGEHDVGLIDPCSSARWFDGWIHKPDPPLEPSPTAPPRTWLLERGWHDGYRFLHLGEVPRALRA
jgi:REP element-mobilizing transposase RayT